MNRRQLISILMAALYLTTWTGNPALAGKFAEGNYGQGHDLRFMERVGSPMVPDFAVYIRRPTQVPRQEHDGRCPVTLRFQAVLISNGAGTARYTWIRSDGARSPEETVRFGRAGSKVVSSTWSLGGAGATLSGWSAIKLLSPAESEPVRVMEFNVRCR